MQQPTLNFVRQRDQDAASRLAPEMYRLLSDGRMHNRRELEQALGTNERVIREIRERSQGRIIGTGSGYVLSQYATVAQHEESEGRMLSMMRKLAQTIRNQRRARNAGGRAA